MFVYENQIRNKEWLFKLLKDRASSFIIRIRFHLHFFSLLNVKKNCKKQHKCEVYVLEFDYIRFLDPENVGLDTKIKALVQLEAENWRKVI